MNGAFIKCVFTPNHKMLNFLLYCKGWRRNLIAFAFGVCATFTLAPFFLFPLVIPAYGGLFLLLQWAPTERRAFFDGWWWGWGFYISGLYWFCIALLTEPEKFAWLIPFALFGLTAVIALYSAFASRIFARLRVGGVCGALLFASVWSLVEFARGHFFTGFPWNLGGYAIGFSDYAMQLASVFGVYGLTWLVVLLGVLPVVLLEEGKHAKFWPILIYLLFFTGCGWGAWRLDNAGSGSYVEDVKLRLVQANIAQHHKWNPDSQMAGLKKHVELTHSPGLEDVTHVVWPETAVPYVIRENTALTRMLGGSLPPGKFLITGGLRAKGERTADWSILNSITMLDHNGAIIGKYDKHKLVPFGEFLPLRWLIPDFLETPVGMKDFEAGAGPQTVFWQGLPAISPLICYEVLFPELIIGDKRPKLLLNLTNDAWFGISSGPYQHYEMARMRAVEQGIPLVRVANTGVTAMIDAHGRVLSSLNLGMAGILDVNVPLTARKPTLYSKYRDFPFFTFLLASFLLIIWQRKRQKN